MSLIEVEIRELEEKSEALEHTVSVLRQALADALGMADEMSLQLEPLISGTRKGLDMQEAWDTEYDRLFNIYRHAEVPEKMADYYPDVDDTRG